MSDSLNLGKVNAKAKAPEFRTEGTLVAILAVHKQLSDVYSLRQLQERFCPNIESALAWYFRSFGAYGSDVIIRYVTRAGADMEQFNAYVQSKTASILRELVDTTGSNR